MEENTESVWERERVVILNVNDEGLRKTVGREVRCTVVFIYRKREHELVWG